MRRLILATVAVIFSFSNFALAADEAKGGSEKEQKITVIKKEPRVQQEKPMLQITMDINQVILPSIDTEKYLLTMVPSRFSRMRDTVPTVLCNSQVVSPWLTAIAKEPLAIFQPGWNGPVPNSWSLTIADFRGKTFHEYKDKFSPPARIVWDGRNADGQPIYVGHPYSYLLVVTDMSGNQYTVVGEPFTVVALLHQESRGLIISIALDSLFNERDKDLRPEGKIILQEVSDILKRYFELPVRIEAWTGDIQAGKNQSGSVADCLAERLIVPVKQFVTASVSETTPNERIDVLIQNR